MKKLLTVLTIIALLQFIGCAERNDPVTPGEKAQFRVLGISQTPGLAQDIFAYDNVLYVADDRLGISIFDGSNLTSIMLTDRIPTLGRVKQVSYVPDAELILDIEGDYIGGYIRTDTGVITAIYNQEWGATDIDAYQTHQDSMIIGIADPTEGILIYQAYTDDFWAPEWIAETPITKRGNYRGMALDNENGYVYLAKDQYGFEIAQISFHPDTITIISEIETPGVSYDVTLNSAKTHALVADFQGGVQIIDIRDKSNPVIVGSVIPDGVDKVERIGCNGDLVCFTDKYNGIFAADISDPANPVLLAHYDSNDPMELFVIDDHTVLLADELIGIIALELVIPDN